MRSGQRQGREGIEEGADLLWVYKAVGKEPQHSDLGPLQLAVLVRTLLLTMSVTVPILVMEHALLVARCGSKGKPDIFLFIF